jgi:hypothetical protein
MADHSNNHPNRSSRAKRSEPEFGWTYGQYLSGITNPLLAKMRQARILESQLRELRREINQDVFTRWSPEEVEQAKKTVHDEYEQATGRPLPLAPRVC